MVFEFLESLDIEDRLRVRVFSWGSGLAFGFAWWLFIDAWANNRHIDDALGVKAHLVLLPFGSTLGMLIIGCMDQSSLNADEYSHHGGKLVRFQARALFGFAALVLLVCFAVSIYVLKHVYLDQHGIKGTIPDSNYVGWSLVFGSFFFIIAAVLLKIGRASDEII